MARERSNEDSYTGRGGQRAVLSELLMRFVNAAIPEVDEGEDILAFLADDPNVARIQVKTATAEALKTEGRYAARFSVPLRQLHARLRIVLYYLFAIRLGDRWADFLVIQQGELRRLYEAGVGYRNRRARELQLHFSLGPQGVTCSGQDFQPYRNAWHLLPVLQAGTNPSPEAGDS